MSARGTVDERPAEGRTRRRNGGKKLDKTPEEKTKLLKLSKDSIPDAAAKSLSSPERTDKQSKSSNTGSSGSGDGSDNEETQGLHTACEPEYEARLTYEQAMMRFGDWKVIRRNVFGYVLIILFSTFTRSFVELLTVTSKMGTIVNGSSPALGCCCNLDRVPEKIQADEWIAAAGKPKYVQKSKSYAYSTSIKGYAAIGLAILGPWIEIYIGRRRLLLLGLAIGSSSAFGMVFLSSTLVIKLCFYCRIVMDMLINVLSFTTLIELVPYNQRFIAPLIIHMGTSLGLALNSIFFLRLRVVHYGIYLGASFFVGFIIAYYFTSDSICHLIATRRLEKAEDTIADIELSQVTNSSNTIYRYHEKVAKKVFEDLAYPDRDELKVFDFLGKLIRSEKLRAIIFLVIQSFSCGFIEFETLRMYSERFARPSLLVADQLMSFTLCFCLMYFLRKTNRARAMTVMHGSMMITIAFRRILLSFDHRNHCGSHLFVDIRFGPFSYFLNVAMGALLNTYMGFVSGLENILLHFLEVAPSILRSSCTILVYVPMSDFRYLIYLLHFVMLVCLLFRNNTMMPYTLYFVDLIPAEVSVKEVDGEDYKEQTPKSYDSPHVKTPQEKKRISV